jgi:hypothetical protein
MGRKYATWSTSEGTTSLNNLRSTYTFLKGSCVLFTLGLSSFCVWGQSNIVYNGSFEASPDPLAGWTVTGTYDISLGDLSAAADGTNSIGIWDSISQDLATVPGRDYVVKFAMLNYQTVAVHWGIQSNVVTTYNPNISAYYFVFTNTSFTADSPLTTLSFEVVSNGFSLDAVQVGWLEEPLTVSIPVPSRSTFEGGSASFPVTVSGSPPLSYQWYKDGVALPAGTNRVLVLTNLAQSDAGQYSVTVTNGYSSVSSLNAQLVVNPLPTIPLIVAQPKSQTVLQGYALGLNVVAFGQAPLSYQWRFNSNDLSWATDKALNLGEVDPTNQGDYTVLVSNQFGTGLSIPATVQVGPVSTGYGDVIMNNRIVGTVDAPVFDTDGVTRLDGSNYVAQTYTSATPDGLHAVGTPSFFRSGRAAGYFWFNTITVPDVLPGQPAYIQIRAWDFTQGSTYEEAQERGARFGKSNLLKVTTGDNVTPAPYLVNLQSFSLQAGLSVLATAKIERGATLPGGQQEWLLIGDPGYVYVVEHRSPPSDWTPLMTLTNVIGVVSFVDPSPQNASINFYRARILQP